MRLSQMANRLKVHSIYLLLHIRHVRNPVVFPSCSRFRMRTALTVYVNNTVTVQPGHPSSQIDNCIILKICYSYSVFTIHSSFNLHSRNFSQVGRNDHHLGADPKGRFSHIRSLISCIGLFIIFEQCYMCDIASQCLRIRLTLN